MQHLGVLEKADLVVVKRQGRQRWNYLNPVPIRALHDRWISAMRWELSTSLRG